MEKPLVIGFDAKRIVSNATGLGSYGRTLVTDLCAIPSLRLRLYAPNSGRDDLREQLPQSPGLALVTPEPELRGLRAALWRSHGIVNSLRRDGVRLYHGLSGELPIGISKAGIPSVLTIHDLIFLRHPEFYHWLDTKIYAWKFRQSIREASHIVAISECTKRDIMELGGVQESRISVIYQGCAPRFRKPTASSKEGLPARYILSVGSIEARKNILLAVRALHYLPDDVSLVVVGRRTGYTDKVEAYVRRNRLEHRVRLMHGVSDERLPALYAHAEAFVYPSIYEGFGIPIIEAINQGLPVVGCTGSCLEEAGGPHSLYVSPDDAEGLSAALQQMLIGSPEREARIEKSRDYVRRFSGNDVAQRMADLYAEEVVRS